MSLSYWEYKTWLSNIDFTIVGSGIVGLNCALYLRKRFPKSKILILEKGFLPQGASTKNAGFACFGSISEILSDLRTISEESVVQLVRSRWMGIQLLRKNLGDKSIGFKGNGGHEVFMVSQEELYDECLYHLKRVNELLKPIFGKEPYQKNSNQFGFAKVKESYITHLLEGQIDTGKMMLSLLEKVQKNKTVILNSITVSSFTEGTKSVFVKTDKFDFKTSKLIFATNGFSARLINYKVIPARAQVLITKPIKNLKIKGTFHLDEGYYYFRDVEDRILLGGGRNLDFTGETTDQFGETRLIQNRLESLLKSMILPSTNFEIDRRWSGIMGVGPEKQPIVKQITNNVFCGTRLGGMGIAIGSSVGRELANLIP